MIRRLSSFINRFYSVDTESMSDDEYFHWWIKMSAVGGLMFAITVVVFGAVMQPPKEVLSHLVVGIVLWFSSFLLIAMLGILRIAKYTEAREQGEKRAKQLIKNLELIGLNVKRSGSRVVIFDRAERITISFIPTSLYVEEIDQGEEE